MFLSEIFNHLTFGELSKIDIGGTRNGVIAVEDYPKIISYINLGMVELYKRFSLKRKSLVLQLDSSLTDYPLTTDYALSNDESAEPIKYILDSQAVPFTGDVLHIERVVNSDGKDLPINELDNDDAVYTPAFDTLNVPEPTSNELLTVHYRAEPTPIDLQTTVIDTVNVNIPYQLLEALLSYVAHRAYIALPTPEPTNSANAYTRFNAACFKAEELGLFNKLTTQNNKLENNGFE